MVDCRQISPLIWNDWWQDNIKKLCNEIKNIIGNYALIRFYYDNLDLCWQTVILEPFKQRILIERIKKVTELIKECRKRIKM